MTLGVAHKDYDVRGGGEILAEKMADGLDAPLIVGNHDPECRDSTTPDIPIHEVAPDSRLHWLADSGGMARAIAQMMLWRDHADDLLRDFDTVVTSGNEPLWWMPREDQTVVAYTHSTPRYFYDLNHRRRGRVKRTVGQIQRWCYRQDLETGIDLWVANSDIVARRMARYWGIDESEIDVVYPPIDTESLSPSLAPTEGYFLILGRLAGPKRVAEAVKAANNQGFELRVAGTGPRFEALQKMASETVDMLGWVTDERKRELLAGASALINCSRNEDFGMAVVEAMASGTPVITVNEGMPAHTVEPGTRGIHFERGGLEDGIKRFRAGGVDWSAGQLHEWARDNFGTHEFVAQMQAAVLKAEQSTQIDPDFAESESPTVIADGGDDESA
jgi:glycosyltransferase involved in cell wall biosynthesis